MTPAAIHPDLAVRQSMRADEPAVPGMHGHNRTIFRPEALLHSRSRADASIFPRLVRPRVFTALWCLLGLSGTASVLAWRTPVPVRSHAIAGVVTGPGGTGGLMLLLPISDGRCLRVGQPVFFRWNGEGPPRRTRIERVVGTRLSPADTRRRFSLESAATPWIDRTGAVAVARLPTDLQPLVRGFDGSSFPAEVEFGERPVGAWISPRRTRSSPCG
jgi:hypothetical protein